jgi:dGTPase
VAKCAENDENAPFPTTPDAPAGKNASPRRTGDPSPEVLFCYRWSRPLAAGLAESIMSELAPYAFRSEDTAGRVYPDPAGDRFDAFTLDRHRILHCTAFHRLAYKTQVFVTHEGDHFRTRLTHTLEVAEIARLLAAELDANADLAEVVALAHDLGHPPFGHAGEAALAECMTHAGGFEHNAQTLRTVDFLEHPFPEFRGLNLSFELRESLAKHDTQYDQPELVSAGLSGLEDLLAAGPLPPIEGQTAGLADRIAYDCHDLEDAIGAELIDEEQLIDLRLWQLAAAPVRAAHRQAHPGAVRRPILDRLLDQLLVAAAGETKRRIEQAGADSPDDVRACENRLVALPGDVEADLVALERFLAVNVY